MAGGIEDHFLSERPRIVGGLLLVDRMGQGHRDAVPRQLQRRLVAKQDTIWAPVVAWLAPLPDVVDMDEAVARVRPARQVAFDAMIDAMSEVLKILTLEQIADFSSALRSSFDLESLKAQRPTRGFFPAY